MLQVVTWWYWEVTLSDFKSSQGQNMATSKSAVLIAQWTDRSVFQWNHCFPISIEKMLKNAQDSFVDCFYRGEKKFHTHCLQLVLFLLSNSGPFTKSLRAWRSCTLSSLFLWLCPSVQRSYTWDSLEPLLVWWLQLLMLISPLVPLTALLPTSVSAPFAALGISQAFSSSFLLISITGDCEIYHYH